MKIKKFINVLSRFDDDKVVLFHRYCLIDKNGELQECISGFQPQDIVVNRYFLRTTFSNLSSKDISIAESPVIITDNNIIHGMTIGELKEYLTNNFNEQDRIYTSGYGGYKLKNKNIHEYNDTILISFDDVLDEERLKELPVVDRKPVYDTTPKKMTVNDLKEWLNQFDGNLPVMVENYDALESQFHLTTDFLKKDKYYMYDDKNNETSIDAIFIVAD